MQKDPRLNARLQIKEHNTSNNIHPMLSGEKSDSKFNFRVNVTTLTQHITSVNYFKSIIDPQAHYQIIPSIPQTLCWNIDGLISAAVEVSRGKILDVALPYRKVQNGKMSKYYFGRYIFSNCKLIGIRLACQSLKGQYYASSSTLKWRQRKLVLISIWEELKVSYRKYNVSFQQSEQIPVGDFILKLSNTTLGIIFKSEINQNRLILQQYGNQGVTILSVLDDTFNHSAHEQNKVNSVNYKTQTFSSDSFNSYGDDKVIILAGVRMVHLDCAYLTKSYIRSQRKTTYGHKSVWSDSWLSGVCTLPQNKEVSYFNPENLQKTTVYKCKFPLNLSRSDTPTQKKARLIDESSQVPQKLIQNIDLLPLFRLIYIYKHINNLAKFIVPITINLLFLLQLERLSKFLGKSLSQILTIYKPKSNKQFGTVPLLNNLTVYESFQELVQRQQAQKIYVYTDFQQQFLELQLLAKQKSNIFICSQYILRVLQTDANHYKRLKQIRTMDSFVNEVMKSNIYDIKQMLKLARSENYMMNNRSLIDAITVKLKQKLRQCFVLTPFAHYFLSKTTEQIFRQLDQLEINLALNNEGISSFKSQNIRSFSPKPSQEDLKSRQKKQNQNKQFTNKLYQAKKLRDKNKSLKDSQCHSCKTRVESSLTFYCIPCRKVTCFPCIDDILKLTGQRQIKNYQFCVFCTKICNCKECIQNKRLMRMEAEQVEKNKVFRCRCERSSYEKGARYNIFVFCSICNHHKCLQCAGVVGELWYASRYICEECIQKRKKGVVDQRKQLDKEMSIARQKPQPQNGEQKLQNSNSTNEKTPEKNQQISQGKNQTNAPTNMQIQNVGKPDTKIDSVLSKKKSSSHQQQHQSSKRNYRKEKRIHKDHPKSPHETKYSRDTGRSNRNNYNPNQRPFRNQKDSNNSSIFKPNRFLAQNTRNEQSGRNQRIESQPRLQTGSILPFRIYQNDQDIDF